jgi:hypothetical protein
MNPDFLQPFVVDLISGKPLIYGFDGASDAGDGLHPQPSGLG